MYFNDWRIIQPIKLDYKRSPTYCTSFIVLNSTKCLSSYGKSRSGWKKGISVGILCECKENRLETGKTLQGPKLSPL